jgi:hypothetical protein
MRMVSSRQSTANIDPNIMYKSNKDYWLSVVTWTLVIVSSITIWYYIGYYTYNLYKLIHKEDKIEFRHTPKLSK